MSKKISRRQLLKSGAGLGLAATIGGMGMVVACGDDDETTTPTDAPDGGPTDAPDTTKETVTMNMIGWGGAQSPIWVDPINARLNLDIQYKGVASMVELNELIAGAPSGTYDIAGFYNHEGTPTLVESGALLPLDPAVFDLSRLDAWSQPSAERTRGPEVYDGDVMYARIHTEYQGLIHNGGTVSTDEWLDKGYELIYEDKYKGRVAFWNDPVQTIPLFGFLEGLNPFDVTDAEFQNMKDRMIAAADQGFMVASYGEGIKALADGTADILGSMNGGAGMPRLKAQGIPAATFFGKSGVLTPSEGFSLMAGSNNPERAVEFALALLEPQSMANVTMKDAWSTPPAAADAWPLVHGSWHDAWPYLLNEETQVVEPKIGDTNWNLVDWVTPINPTRDKWVEAWAEFQTAIG
ncbi:MAG: extracellular solute-binding protein [Chloroflexi bacterium]|nr:extracellular solute-binding protein [Chloroflexota bacterium]